MSRPGIHELLHYQGDSLAQPFTISYRNANGTVGDAVDLTGWTAQAVARSARTGAPLTGVSATLGNQATSPGLVTLEATAEATAAWTAGPSVLIDVQLTETATGFVRTVITFRMVMANEGAA